MKKLMIALAVAACAVAANAAAFNWTSSGTNASKTFYGPNGSSTIPGMTVYLLDATTVSQADLVEGIRGGKTIADFTTISSQALDSNSRLTAKEISYGEAGGNYSFYMAIIDTDNIFVSDVKAASGQASSTVNVQFSGIKAATQTAFGDATYSSAGWYSTAAVPEPTSGLLLLLGMAGLALKRKRA